VYTSVIEGYTLLFHYLQQKAIHTTIQYDAIGQRAVIPNCNSKFSPTTNMQIAFVWYTYRTKQYKELSCDYRYVSFYIITALSSCSCRTNVVMLYTILQTCVFTPLVVGEQTIVISNSVCLCVETGGIETWL